MATSEDVKPESEPQDADAEALPEGEQAPADEQALVAAEQAELAGQAGVSVNDAEEPVMRAAGAVTQLGTRRYVYAGYFAGAIAIAFIMSKVLGYAWYRLQTYKPSIGEPSDEIVMAVSALIGGLAAVYYWYRTRARELAEEVATEMSKVTWPTRTEVTNGTFVVIVTTIISTVFFALMDKFWGFVTNLVYGGS
jgi:preprotein translocase subunit SecE